MGISLDADKYKINKKIIELMLINKTPEERMDAIGRIAIATAVPIIIVCYYVVELFGFTAELETKIKYLRDFYGVDEVLNVPVRTNLP